VGECPKSAASKIQTAIRFDPDVPEGFRATAGKCGRTMPALLGMITFSRYFSCFP
jgi:hypothetical protein